MIRFAYIKTPFGDDVTIQVNKQSTKNREKFIVTIADGPHDGERFEAYNKARADEIYREQCDRHRTGLMTCEPCDGTGVVEFIRDIWSNDSHTTEEWSEDCDHCGSTGKVEDANLLP